MLGLVGNLVTYDNNTLTRVQLTNNGPHQGLLKSELN